MLSLARTGLPLRGNGGSRLGLVFFSDALPLRGGFQPGVESLARLRSSWPEKLLSPPAFLALCASRASFLLLELYHWRCSFRDMVLVFLFEAQSTEDLLLVVRSSTPGIFGSRPCLRGDPTQLAAGGFGQMRHPSIAWLVSSGLISACSGSRGIHRLRGCDAGHLPRLVPVRLCMLQGS